MVHKDKIKSKLDNLKPHDVIVGDPDTLIDSILTVRIPEELNKIKQKKSKKFRLGILKDKATFKTTGTFKMTDEELLDS